MPRQSSTRYPAAYMRGGTSRAILFRGQDLPPDPAQWADIFRCALGSPDSYGRQLDGLGGGISSLSKVAVITPSRRTDADVDYHFFQVDPRTGAVLTRVNCGNISSAVGPFALSQGWIADQEQCLARIYNVNSGKIIHACFEQNPDVRNFIGIDGVHGMAPRIRLRFLDPAASLAGRLFPTGRRQEALVVNGLGTVQATLIDATLPTVIVDARSAGLRGDESPDELAGRMDYEALRIAAALKMRLADDPRELHGEFANVPDVVFVSPAQAGAIQARFYSSGNVHRAAPVTSSIALACACHIEGTVAQALIPGWQAREHQAWKILHPAGTMEVGVRADAMAGQVASADVDRTARLIMLGSVVIPTCL